MSSPQIQFNGRCLVQPLTGVQRYVLELSRNLANELSTIRPAPEWAHGLGGHLWEQICLPGLCDRRLLWSPGNTGPLACANQVVTIHDASTLDHPEWFERKFAALYGWLLPKLARRVRGIITVSAFSKERLVSRLGVVESKIHVVPNGLSEEFCPQQATEYEGELRLKGPFFLYVGSLEPRKNLGCLLKAWDEVAFKDWRLVIVGDRAGIFESVSLKTHSPQVLFTGRLGNRELRSLYRAGHAFVSPSVYEGFGLPPLEAMACGCPCVISDIPPHREVCGGAPMYVPVSSVTSWVDALREAAAWSPDERERRKQLGLCIAREFSWTKTAEKTLAILNSYRDCARSGSRRPSKSAIPRQDIRMKTPYIQLFGRKYLSGRRLNILALAFLVLRDIALAPFFGGDSRSLPKREEINEICVCKLDHLGDLLMLTPFLAAFRRNVPNAKVTLIVGRWCRELADILQRGGLIDQFVCYTAFSLDKRKRNVLARLATSFFGLGFAWRLLRKRRFDLFVDMRPYFPCAWLLAILSGAKVRAGFGLRGMSDSFHVILPYSANKRLGQIYLEAIPSITGAGLIYEKPILPSTRTRSKLVNDFGLPERYLAVQLSSREKARNIDSALWTKILALLRSTFSIVLLGLADDERWPELEQTSGLLSLIGKTNIDDLLGIIEESVGVVSVDSFAAHVGLAYSRTVAVLMVEPYSQQRSYPENNPHLRLFPASDGVERAIARFFATDLLVS
jgi:glycosyltransferase involved in cell wall biosynthesis/ADP-heptose:LPS heptosyltransferase